MSANIEHNKKKDMRDKLRTKRRSLSILQHKMAAQNLYSNLSKSQLLLRAKHIALYIGNDGEISPQLLLHALWAQNKHCYLPVLHPLRNKQLVFCRVDPHSKMKENRFGIKEPLFKHSIKLAPNRLSLVLLPLVAFDLNGNRLGMGGGFYDRTFAFKNRSRRAVPRLIGLAHEFQRQNDMKAQAWDVSLDGVITDQEIYIKECGNKRVLKA